MVAGEGVIVGGTGGEGWMDGGGNTNTPYTIGVRTHTSLRQSINHPSNCSYSRPTPSLRYPTNTTTEHTYMHTHTHTTTEHTHTHTHTPF